MTKSKITTTILLVMTMGLMAGILFAGYMITRPVKEKVSISPPSQTKAEKKTYSRSIILKTILPTAVVLSETNPTPTPENDLVPVQASEVSNQKVAATPTQAIPTVSPTPTLTPIPTEIILAKAVTPAANGVQASRSAMFTMLSPTKTSSLPQTGTVSGALFIFAAAGLMIFFSFLF